MQIFTILEIYLGASKFGRSIFCAKIAYQKSYLCPNMHCCLEGAKNLSYALEELAKQIFSLNVRKTQEFKMSKIQGFLELVKKEKECF